MTDDYKPYQLQTVQARQNVTFDLGSILGSHSVLLEPLWKKCLFHFDDTGCSSMITLALL